MGCKRKLLNNILIWQMCHDLYVMNAFLLFLIASVFSDATFLSFLSKNISEELNYIAISVFEHNLFQWTVQDNSSIIKIKFTIRNNEFPSYFHFVWISIFQVTPCIRLLQTMYSIVQYNTIKYRSALLWLHAIMSIS